VTREAPHEVQGPLVGLLYNPAIPTVLDACGAQVDFIEVVPDRLWYDFGVGERARFSPMSGAIDELKRYTERHRVIGHGIGLSLPSAMPIDDELLHQVVLSHRELSYSWYSEHLSMFLAPHRSVPNAQAGLGLPVAFDDEVLEIVTSKVLRIGHELGTRVLLENPTVFTPIPESDMTEPQFFNRLHLETGCGMLLDFHNLYANTRNTAVSASEYLSELRPEIVVEVHLAGGDALKGFYTDSHSGPSPAAVWEWAHEWCPRFPNLAAITFEYHESYHHRMGITGVGNELRLMHVLASEVAAARTNVSARG
jgi:uncharacterized protein (UPF0276 family)